MQRTDELARENRELRELLSRLRQASLRINESLDFDHVLQGALDSARSLTGARYGVITVVDDAGMPREFLSSGMTAAEARRIWETPDGMRIFRHLADLPEPLRIPDLLEYLRAGGLPEFSPPAAVETALSFMAAPILQQGRVVGSIYVADKEQGREFTPDDENTLVMFASQAALVIANARRHRDEQRARADLETLVDTSPVGVIVIDATQGRVASLNREALRIAEDLLAPGDTVERALETLAFRRADGREVSLAEFTLAQALSSAETVRAEEITLELPDGRSLTTLVNATPIRGEDGEVASFVVTVQDLSPLEDLERLRADFLGMVSHELRTPLTSISGSAATLLSQGTALDPAETRQFHRVIAEQADLMRRLLSDLLDATRLWTGALPVSPEPSEPAALVEEARTAFLAGGGGHGITLDLEPELPWVMADRRRVLQVLGNLLANAARHSSSTSPIRVSAAHQDGWVSVSVADRGCGIAPERLPHLFRRFSTDDMGGGEDRNGTASGLGLSICRGIVEAHGGRIRAESDGLGQGSRLTFTLPVAEGIPALSGRDNGPAQDSEDEARILVVDDDAATLRHVRSILSGAGYAPLIAGGPTEAMSLMAVRNPHLVLLDLMLPGTDGIELMQELRYIADVPFVFLSAYGQEDVVARAFDTGADDYVVKPFSSTELLARIRAALRRRAVQQAQPYVRGELVVDYAERRVTIAGRVVPLRPLEYGLLAELATNAGRPLSYEHLSERVWKRRDNNDPRRIRSAVRSLRRKLGDDAERPFYIFTEPRVGYRMPPSETVSR